MSTLIICLLIACLFPYLAKIPLVMAMNKQPGGYDNNYPRLQQSALAGFGARACAAHQNSFESLIIFVAAILTALATNHTGRLIQGLAILYLITRSIYHAFYLLNWASFRSLIWAVSLLTSLIIIVLCLF